MLGERFDAKVDEATQLASKKLDVHARSAVHVRRPLLRQQADSHDADHTEKGHRLPTWRNAGCSGWCSQVVRASGCGRSQPTGRSPPCRSAGSTGSWAFFCPTSSTPTTLASLFFINKKRTPLTRTTLLPCGWRPPSAKTPPPG